MGCSALANGKFSKVRVTLCQWLRDQAEAEWTHLGMQISVQQHVGRDGQFLSEGQYIKLLAYSTKKIYQPRNHLNNVLWNTGPLESPPWQTVYSTDCVKQAENGVEMTTSLHILTSTNLLSSIHCDACWSCCALWRPPFTLSGFVPFSFFFFIKNLKNQ